MRTRAHRSGRGAAEEAEASPAATASVDALLSDDGVSDVEEVKSRPRKRPRAFKAGGAAQERTSQFRGVTHHVRTGRYEAHIWQGGKQLYLGGFGTEREAALAYDLAALKFRGGAALTNYRAANYREQLASLQQATCEEVVQLLRRQSKGYVKTSSQYRGVTRHQKGKWEARTGCTSGKKYKYLGLFLSEVEAAKAYDRECVLVRGLSAITNFDLSEYVDLLTPEDLERARREGLLKPRPAPLSLLQPFSLTAAAAAEAPEAAPDAGPDRAPEGMGMEDDEALPRQPAIAMTPGAGAQRSQSLPAAAASAALELEEDPAGYAVEALTGPQGAPPAPATLTDAGCLVTVVSAPGSTWKPGAEHSQGPIFGWPSSASAMSASTPLGVHEPRAGAPFGPGAAPEGPLLPQEEWLQEFSAAQQALPAEPLLEPLPPKNAQLQPSPQEEEQGQQGEEPLLEAPEAWPGLHTELLESLLFEAPTEPPRGTV